MAAGTGRNGARMTSFTIGRTEPFSGTSRQINKLPPEPLAHCTSRAGATHQRGAEKKFAESGVFRASRGSRARVQASIRVNSAGLLGSPGVTVDRSVDRICGVGTSPHHLVIAAIVRCAGDAAQTRATQLVAGARALLRVPPPSSSTARSQATQRPSR